VSAQGHQNASAIATVLDDDTGISIARSGQGSMTELTGQASLIDFVVSRAGNLGAARVSWAVNPLGLNGVDLADFAAGQDLLGNQGGLPSGEIVFQEGEASKTIQIRVAADAVVENSESFVVRLLGVALPNVSSPVQKILVSESAATVMDDDSADASNNVLQGGGGVDFLSGGAGNDLIQGGAGADRIFGGEGNDTISSGGGGDAIYGGSGNDLIIINGDTLACFEDVLARIDGGFSTDTLRLDAANQTINLEDILELDANFVGYGRISSIEKIDLTGSGDNQLVLGSDEVKAVTGANVFAVNGRHQLMVLGNTGDKVDVTDGSGTQNWSEGPTVTLDAVAFSVWNHVSQPTTLYIQTSILVI
jgi:Ca2+-binding RTX toxin-like protein